MSRSDLLVGLGGDLGGERLLLGVGGAGEQEVLADQEAEFVGEVVEVVALVAAAAPDPQVVDAGVDGLADPGGVAGAGRRGSTNASSGIQLTPRTKTGTPLTTRVNAVPAASAVVSSSTVRNPIRRCHVSSGPRCSWCRVTVEVVAVRAPYPRGHHSRTSGTGDHDHRLGLARAATVHRRGDPADRRR